MHNSSWENIQVRGLFIFNESTTLKKKKKEEEENSQN